MLGGLGGGLRWALFTALGALAFFGGHHADFSPIKLAKGVLIVNRELDSVGCLRSWLAGGILGSIISGGLLCLLGLLGLLCLRCFLSLLCLPSFALLRLICLLCLLY